MMVQPGDGGTFLATCALGFTDPAMPTGVFACPNADEMCAVAGGYAYVIDTAQPEQSTHIALKPVVEVRRSLRKGCCCLSASIRWWRGAATASRGSRRG